MSNARFATARDLFEAFPTASSDIGIVEPREMRSADFARLLAGREQFRATLSFCAYLLPRREAVWWGCQSLREAGTLGPDEDGLVAAAESWVREPDDHRRRHALDLGSQGDTNLAGCWICLGAGWAGGTIKVDAEHSVPIPPHATAQAIRAGVILAADRLPAGDPAPMQRRWVEAAVQLAEAGVER